MRVAPSKSKLKPEISICRIASEILTLKFGIFFSSGSDDPSHGSMCTHGVDGTGPQAPNCLRTVTGRLKTQASLSTASGVRLRNFRERFLSLYRRREAHGPLGPWARRRKPTGKPVPVTVTVVPLQAKATAGPRLARRTEQGSSARRAARSGIAERGNSATAAAPSLPATRTKMCICAIDRASQLA